MPPHAEMDFTRSRLSKEQIERLKKEKDLRATPEQWRRERR